ncbi:DUF3558 domain-containing protein [Amycolatopsis sp. OK19-0408]|uniref:DUF3558 domain-containing protein n=1 Tax=Amycolatopsis iheyensis TaxID=2945988 RepID=A0A9X2SNP4_9PSEU|nr:DUF3558 domain-containing protein [Amycolatopsis iheyensis]MCR6488183.1 DUF3558 domain-containing protein [Amycolatopsis iheyensis]
MVLTACSPSVSGKALPASTPPSADGGQVPGPGVPKVEVPLDTEAFKSAPCTALSQDQVTELFGYPVAPKPDPTGPGGPGCDWDTVDGSRASAHVLFTTVDDLGLTSVYRAQGKAYKFFQPLAAIEGYPVVAYGTSDARSTGRCSVALGTTDHSTVDITIFQTKEKIGKTDPCEVAHAVAEKVLASLKSGR